MRNETKQPVTFTLREIVVFGYDIVIHRTPNVVITCGQSYNKINDLR